MSGQEYRIIFIVVLLNFNIFTVFCDDSSAESQPKYEYIQIFKSIPALFEYLLNALEERPEILEKNDVTMFKRNLLDPENEEFESSDNEKKTEKRDADCDDPKRHDEHTKDIAKRDAKDSEDVSETTKAYEYGNSNVIMNSLEDPVSNKIISKRTANNDDLYNFADDKIFERDIGNLDNKINVLKKRHVLFKLDDGDINDMFRNYGEAFFGFEHLFGLDLKPEEIEERVLTAEKLLEEHNNKKEKEE